MRMDEYLETVCAGIRWKAARKPVREELAEHIRQRAEEYVSAGDTRETAEEKAVSNMGDAEQTGRELDRLHRQRFDWVLMGALAALLLLGMLYAATAMRGIAARPILFALAGLPACALFSFADMRKLLRGKAVPTILFAICLTAVAAEGIANNFKAPQGTPFPFDLVTAFCSLGMLLTLWLKAGRVTTGMQFELFLAAVASGAVALIAEPSFSVAVTFIICSYVMLWSTGLKKKKKAILILTGGVLAVAAIFVALAFSGILFPFTDRLWRVVQLFTDPSSSDAFFLNQARQTVAGLSLFGPSNLISEMSLYHGMLPNTTSDYMLLNFMLRYGITAGLAVTGLCGVLFWRAFGILQSVRDASARPMLLAVFTFLAVQAALYVLMNFGLLPNMILSGIPMFTQVWYQSLLLGAATGMLIGLYRKKDLYTANSTPGSGVVC